MDSDTPVPDPTEAQAEAPPQSAAGDPLAELHDRLVGALAATGMRMSANRLEILASALRDAYAAGQSA